MGPLLVWNTSGWTSTPKVAAGGDGRTERQPASREPGKPRPAPPPAPAPAYRPPTYILLLELARQVTLHERRLPGATIAHQDELRGHAAAAVSRVPAGPAPSRRPPPPAPRHAP
jgi:hypothetical protein